MLAFANGCTVNNSFGAFTGPVVTTTKSYMEVEPQPTGPFPNRGKAVVVWQRERTGPVNPAYQIRVMSSEIATNHDQPALKVPAVWQLLPLLRPTNLPLEVDETFPTWKAIKAIRVLQGSNPLVMRETGSDPARKPAPLPEYTPFEHPKLKTQPDVVIGNGPPYLRPTTHEYAPPPSGVKERKLRMPKQAVAYVILNALTETGDFIESLHDALPPGCRRSRTWKDKQGNYHRRRIDSMLRDLFFCWPQLDARRALANVVANELEDQVIGRANRRANTQRGTQQLSSGPGAGTTISKAADAAGESTFGGLGAAKEGLTELAVGPQAKGQSNYRRDARRAGRGLPPKSGPWSI